MKIGIFVHEFRNYSGVSGVVEQQANDLIDRGHQVTIFTLKHSRDLNSSVRVVEMGAPHSNILTIVYKLIYPLDIFKNIKYALILKDYDVIIAHLYSLTWTCCLAKILFQNKYYIYHDYGYPNLEDVTFKERMYLFFMKVSTNISTFNVDKIISISQYMANRLPRRHKGKSVVIYIRVDPNRYNVQSMEIDDNRCEDYSPIFLYVGRLSKTKGIGELIESFRQAQKKLPKSRLIIVGRPYFGFDMQCVRNALEKDKQITWVGQVTDQELISYYHHCDVYVSASKWEGFGLPIIEAQICGKPVVAFGVGAHPELIRDGITGIIVKPFDTKEFADAMVEAYHNKERMGEQAKIWAEYFSTNNEDEQISSLIDQIKW